MFSDPYLLEKEERASLVSQLEQCVAQYPEVSELRVLLAMALCVNFDAQAAIEELRESVRLAPDSFIAQLKFGELWMRLRVIDQAEEHTQLAAKLARNLAQSEMARRQASSIRTMKREGIERGGYGTPLAKAGIVSSPCSGCVAAVNARPHSNSADHAASPSACAAACHSAARWKVCGIAVHSFRHSRDSR